MSYHSSMKILVADDEASTRVLLRTMLARNGYQVVEAADGLQALEVFEREQPDMVLLDVVMPGLDGYEVASRITRHLAKNFVPVIFLTANDDDETMLKCIDSGGDDVLLKPVNGVLLMARIRAMQRILSLYVSLEDYHSRTEEELQLARHVFSMITQRMKNFIPGLGHWTRSAGHLPGDLILYDTTPSGLIYAMVADFTGHGLAAAVGAIPVADIFFALTRKDFALEDIIVEINRKLRQIFPIGHFCAATFVSSDPTRGHVRVWNGGLPEALLVSQHREIIARFPSRNLALGIVGIDKSDVKLMDAPDAFGGKLLLYTDGLTECQNKDGGMFGEEGLQQVISESVGVPLFDTLQQAILRFSEGTKPVDDISLLVLPIKYSEDLDIWT